MRRNTSNQLPGVFIWFYPELRRIEGRRAQWEALGRANRLNAILFAVLILALTAFLPDMMEASFRRVFGLGGATNDLVTTAAFIALMIAVFGALMYFGGRRARRNIRVELAQAGHAICIDCGYDLRNLQESRCPECGKTFRGPDASS